MANRTTVAVGVLAPTSTRSELRPENLYQTSLTFQNLGAVDVYLGGSAVTIANGYKLAVGCEITVVSCRTPWFGITESGTGNLRYVEFTGDS